MLCGRVDCALCGVDALLGENLLLLDEVGECASALITFWSAVAADGGAAAE